MTPRLYCAAASPCSASCRVSASGVCALVVPWLTSPDNESVKPRTPSHRVTECRRLIRSLLAAFARLDTLSDTWREGRKRKPANELEADFRAVASVVLLKPTASERQVRRRITDYHKQGTRTRESAAAGSPEWRQVADTAERQAQFASASPRCSAVSHEGAQAVVA